MKRAAALIAAIGAGALVLADLGAAPLVLVRLATVGATLGAAATIDLLEHRIPNRLTLPAIATCAVLAAVAGVCAATAAGLAVLLILLVVSLVVPSFMGMGDIKLMLVIVLGLERTAIRALVFGLLVAGIVAAIIVIRQGRQAGHKAVPLAPALALGTLLAVL